MKYITGIIGASLLAGIGLCFVDFEVAKENPLVMENVEALASIENYGGKWYIVDDIPCASSADEWKV